MKWAAKMVAKILISRLPGPYSLYRRLGVFRHGAMNSSDYAIQTIRAHVDRANALGLPPRFSALELGPGDSLASALILRCLGATHTYLVDTDHFATQDTRVYKELMCALESQELKPPAPVSFASLESYLDTCGGQYLPHGLDALRSLPDDSIDLSLSHAVLEHIRLAEFESLAAELYRIMRPGGLCSHRVDLRDHLAAGLNNLRFSEKLWESDWMAKSGFYTNRLRCYQVIEHMRAVGFTTVLLKKDVWSELPISRSKLHPSFRSMSQEELLVSGFDVVFRK